MDLIYMAIERHDPESRLASCTALLAYADRLEIMLGG